MNVPTSLKNIEGMDIYLIDQIMKGRYQVGERILDAGAGGGRNLNWFFSEGFQMHACDKESEREKLIAARFPNSEFNWSTCGLEEMPYEDEFFDHVICNAVLHFARDRSHFIQMWSELIRITKVGGSIFIRTCSDIGMEELVDSDINSPSRLPDGSLRYLLRKSILADLFSKSGLAYLEAVKSVHVDDLRVMTTLVMARTR